MVEWRLKDADLKKYPHFDSLVPTKEAQAFALDPVQVARHTFYPFLRYTNHWTRFAKKGKQGKSKSRPIRYAARRDAYVYARYRHILSECYESELTRLGLDQCVLAYRRILKTDNEGGKCNIDFAFDAFTAIQKLGDCCAIALDISSFFEHLDHEKIKSMWCRLLGVDNLPPDHFQVFKNITRYSYVDKQAVYERLGYFGNKKRAASGEPIKGYLVPYKDIPKKLCSGNEFREKIAGGGSEKSLIQVNLKNYGIPQGAPISDLLANIYLLDFDKTILDRVNAVGGYYFRYSDDILIVAPGDAEAGKQWLADVQALIRQHGKKLRIKAEKCAVFSYSRNGTKQCFTRIHGEQGGNGLEYLGFRYDGRKVYLRDSTLSGLRRKVTLAARRDAITCAQKHPTKNAINLRAEFNYERLIKRFGKVESFSEKYDDVRHWTFWTYARRAAEIFGSIGSPILRQLRRHAELVRERSNQELTRAVERRKQP